MYSFTINFIKTQVILISFFFQNALIFYVIIQNKILWEQTSIDPNAVDKGLTLQL